MTDVRKYVLAENIEEMMSDGGVCLLIDFDFLCPNCGITTGLLVPVGISKHELPGHSRHGAVVGD